MTNKLKVDQMATTEIFNMSAIRIPPVLTLKTFYAELLDGSFDVEVEL